MATTPVTFVSENASLTLQDESRFKSKPDGIWAQFEDGRFTTDDPKVIELLDQVDGVSRAEDGAPAADSGDASNSSDEPPAA